MTSLKELLEITEALPPELTVADYIISIQKLSFTPITRGIWKALENAGLTVGTNHHQWSYAILPISEKDRKGLIELDADILAKFDLFDTQVKEAYQMTCMTMIDYGRGIVRVVRVSKDRTLSRGLFEHQF